MMGSDAVLYTVGSICFGLSTAVGIRLRDDLTVPTAATLAPAAAVLSLQVVDQALWPIVCIGPLVAFVALVFRRAPILEVVSHVLLFGSLNVIYLRLSDRVVGSTLALITVVLCGALSYSLLEVGRQKLSFRGHAHIRADFGMWCLLQLVLICAAGLTVLVVEQLGAMAFVAMAAVLALTKREFEGFALSRIALEQTVIALEQLKSRAG